MIEFVAAGIQSTYHIPLLYLRWRSNWSVLYLLLMGCTAIQILRWVVTLSIWFDLSNPIFSVRAKYSGVTTECLEFSTTLLTNQFLCAIFALDLAILMQLGAASFTLIAGTNGPSAVSATSELVNYPKIRSLLWKKSVGPPLIYFLDIYATHALYPYSMFMSIVTFYGSHYTSMSVKTMREQVSNSWYDGT